MQSVKVSGKLWGVVHAKHYNYFTSKPPRRFTFTRSITIISHQCSNCFPALFPSVGGGISLSEEMFRRHYNYLAISTDAIYTCYTSDTLHVTHCVHIFRFSTKLPVSRLLLHFFMSYSFVTGLRSIFLQKLHISFMHHCISDLLVYI